MPIPTITDILTARHVLADRLPPTPAWSYPALNDALGATVVLKHENVQPTGAFKVRGGLTLLSRMPADERRRGVVTYSTGNHGQSIAYAARAHGVPCVVVVPQRANPTKLLALRAQGADLVEAGPTLESARQRAEEIAGARRMRLVSPADEPDLVAGVATAYVELFEAHPALDVLVVPVGSGTGAAAACLAAAAFAPSCRVIGVQSEDSPAAHDSWRSGTPVSRPNRTVIDGLATGAGFELTQRILRGSLADFVLVSDALIRAAQHLMLTHAHTLVEGAGAAGLAAVLAAPERYAGASVGLVVTGGNASVEETADVLATSEMFDSSAGLPAALK